MRTLGALLAGAALVVVTCGCSRGDGNAAPTTSVAAPSSTARPVTTRPPTTTVTTTSFPGPSLETLVLQDVPSEYPRRPDSLAATGPTDLEKAAREDPLNDEAEARRILRQAGFLRGHQRQWSTSNAVGQNFIFLYQFATAAGASSYVSHWRTTVIADDGGDPPVPFTPTTVPGAIGLENRTNRASSGVVLFSKGVYAVQAIASGGPRVDPRAPSSSLALAQWALLP